MLPCVSGMANMYHHTQILLIEMGGSHEFFAQAGLQWQFSQSTSQIAKTIGLSHCTWLNIIFFFKQRKTEIDTVFDQPPISRV
jgi:hypothetical protein